MRAEKSASDGEEDSDASKLKEIGAASKTVDDKAKNTAMAHAIAEAKAEAVAAVKMATHKDKKEIAGELEKVKREREKNQTTKILW